MARRFDDQLTKGTDTYLLLPPGADTYTFHVSDPEATIDFDAAGLTLRGNAIVGGGGGGGSSTDPTFNSVTIGGITLTDDYGQLVPNNGVPLYPQVPWLQRDDLGTMGGALRWGSQATESNIYSDGVDDITITTGQTVHIAAPGGLFVNGTAITAGGGTGGGGTGVSITNYTLYPWNNALTPSPAWVAGENPSGPTTVTEIQYLTWPTLANVPTFISGFITYNIASTAPTGLLPTLLIYNSGTGLVYTGGASQQVTSLAAGYDTYTFPFTFFATPQNITSYMQMAAQTEEDFNVCVSFSQMTTITSVADTLSAHFE
jgi:hypothetical protein